MSLITKGLTNLGSFGAIRSVQKQSCHIWSDEHLFTSYVNMVLRLIAPSVNRLSSKLSQIIKLGKGNIQS